MTLDNPSRKARQSADARPETERDPPIMPSLETATASPPRRLIDADQVAAKLGMSRRQVFRSADYGRIPPGLKLGRLRRWDEVVIDAFIADGCRPPRREGCRP